jgi:hypothetical protein
LGIIRRDVGFLKCWPFEHLWSRSFGSFTITSFEWDFWKESQSNYLKVIGESFETTTGEINTHGKIYLMENDGKMMGNP